MANGKTARYDDLIEIMNEERRRRIVIDFIDRNQGCTAEDIVNGQNKIGRVKVFRLIKDLKKENVILTDISRNNRRNKRLFLNEANPLTSFPKEIKDFF
jgi:Tfp pilus assembly ATPase PilU